MGAELLQPQGKAPVDQFADEWGWLQMMVYKGSL